MKTLIVGAVAAVGFVAVIAARSGGPADQGKAKPPASLHLQDDFSRLDPARWSTTSAGDFEEKTVDAVDGRLRIRCSTRGTREETVKFLGVGGASALQLTEGTVISFDLDWNGQENGCYLSAGLILASSLTTGNPLEAERSLKVEYVGVPPGKNGRLLVEARMAGRLHQLFTEGWPVQQRAGRPLGLQQVEITIGRRGAFTVTENGRPLFESAEGALGFSSGHLYLQVSSHSNYGPREVYFDNVRVENH